MQGEGVHALQQMSDFTGPVPSELVIKDILARANEPEPVITQGLVSEIRRTKRKQARLDQGLLFTPEMLEASRQIRLESKGFDIC
jgi:hypothetical protein